MTGDALGIHSVQFLSNAAGVSDGPSASHTWLPFLAELLADVGDGAALSQAAKRQLVATIRTHVMVEKNTARLRDQRRSKACRRTQPV